MTWVIASLRTDWRRLIYRSPRCGAANTRGDSGNASYPKQGDGRQGDCASTVRITCAKSNED